MPCCGDESKSESLLGRIFSPETIERMVAGASKRPYRGGKPRTWRKELPYRNWRKQVLLSFGGRCAITLQTVDLVVHHLISAHSSSYLVYEPLNGIVIASYLHKIFHDRYEYRLNTVEQFIDFLTDLLREEELSTLISSQASSGEEEGSETRAYDPERIRKLQEYLKDISTTLNKKLADAQEEEQS